MNLFTLSAKLTLDDSVFYSGLKSAEQNAQKVGTRIENALRSGVTNAPTASKREAESAGGTLANSFAAGFLKARVIEKTVDAAFQFVEKGIDTASQLAEVQNVIDTAFGGSAESANEWAKAAKSAYGMSELTAKRYLGQFRQEWASLGDLPTETMDEMSMAMVGLVGDYASFMDSDFETAAKRVNAVITGNTQAIEQWGVSLHAATLEEYAASIGMDEKYKKMSELEKRMLRYNYVMEVSKNVQGDFVKTQGSYSNQMRLLQENMNDIGASIGSSLLPVLTSVVSGLNSLVNPEKDLADTIGGIDAAYSKTLESLNSQKVEVDAMISRLASLSGNSKLTQEQQAEWERVLSSLSATLPGVNALIGEQAGEIQGGADALKDYSDNYFEMQRREAMSQSLKKRQSAVDSARNELIDKKTELNIEREKLALLMEQAGVTNKREAVNLNQSYAWLMNRGRSWAEKNGMLTVFESVEAAQKVIQSGANISAMEQDVKKREEQLKTATAELETYQTAWETVWNETFGSGGTYSETPDTSGIETAADSIESRLSEIEEQANRTAQALNYAFSGGGGGPLTEVSYPHAYGLPYVPYDDYPARLHRGEMVLTRNESEQYRGQSAGTGYDLKKLVKALNQRPFNLSIDGKTFARGTADIMRRVIDRKTTAELRARGG